MTKIKGIQFGEHFEIDTTNRLNPLADVNQFPPYVQMGLQVREKLKDVLKDEPWSPFPDKFEDIGDLFDQARNVVTHYWNEKVMIFIADAIKQYEPHIPAISEYKEIKKILLDPQKLEQIIELRQFGILEPLRKVLPALWRTLVLISSERQLAMIALMRHWSKDIPEKKLQKTGMGRNELQLFIDFASLLGKYVDHAYIKQIELADAPGGSMQSKLGYKQGAEYVYDLYQRKGVQFKTYSQVFPFEWSRIVTRLTQLAARADDLISRGKIPQTYRAFSPFLIHMADVYGSAETSPKKLNLMWEKLQKETTDMAKTGCPIMVIPQGTPGVAGEANKVDTEIRLGIRTPETKQLEELFSVFRHIAQQSIDQNSESLSEPYQVPPLIPNIQPFAFGPNLYWMTRGESAQESMVSHINVIRDIAQEKEIPLLRKAFADKTIDDSEYQDAAIIETGLHEMAHTVFSDDDEAVHERLGESSEAVILEELKADTVSMKLLSEYLLQCEIKGQETYPLAQKQFLAKIGTLCDYLVNKSSSVGGDGERYYYTAAAIVQKLLEKRIIVIEKGKCTIINSRKGIEIIANMGDEILQEHYINKNGTPKQVKKAGRALRNTKKDIGVKNFIHMLKT